MVENAIKDACFTRYYYYNYCFGFISSVGSNSTDSKAAANDAAKKKAAENYKREANLKAGAVAHGNQREAAFAQARMDKSMADMVSGDLSTRNEYSRQAQLKAGHIAHGNTEEAAKCQARMDRLMADMISKK